jgi:hypothetical protein
MAIRDPKSHDLVNRLTTVFAPKNAPPWYEKELNKANLSKNRIVNMLPPSALAKPRSGAEEELAALIPESKMRKKIKIRIKKK